jgi:hypothetical protein
MNRHLIQVAEGALGAAAGTLFLHQSMRLMGRLPEHLQPQTKGDPSEYVVSKAERVAHRTLSPNQRQRAKQSAPWVYGIGWGVLLGALAPFLDLRSPGRAVAAGATLGAGVWAIGYAGWMPAAGLMEPLHRQGPRRSIAPLLSHMLYGVTAALPIFLIERWREPRRARWRQLLARYR